MDLKIDQRLFYFKCDIVMCWRLNLLTGHHVVFFNLPSQILCYFQTSHENFPHIEFNVTFPLSYACSVLFVALNLIKLLLRVHYYFHENGDTNLCYGQGKRDECIKTATDKWNCRNIWEKYYINITFVHG